MLRYKIDGIFFLFVFLISLPHFISYSKEEKPDSETSNTFERLLSQVNKAKLNKVKINEVEPPKKVLLS